MRSAEARTVSFRAVATVSVRGSSGRRASSGAAAAEAASQWSSSAVRRGACASASRCPVQVRREVGTGSSAGARPAATASWAARRSGSRICQDTSSTARWCAASSSRPEASGPRSKCTARSITPDSGSSSRDTRPDSRASSSRSSASSQPAASTASRTDPAATAPTGSTSALHTPGRATVSVCRSPSWWSSTACSAATRATRSVPAGSRTSRACANEAKGPPRSASHCATGGSGSGPGPPSAGRAGAAGASARRVATEARAAGVGCWKTCRAEMVSPAFRASPTSRMETMLSPPSSK